MRHRTDRLRQTLLHLVARVVQHQLQTGNDELVFVLQLRCGSIDEMTQDGKSAQLRTFVGLTQLLEQERHRAIAVAATREGERTQNLVVVLQ